jgi:hypothetical protein
VVEVLPATLDVDFVFVKLMMGGGDGPVDHRKSRGADLGGAK